jgi:very-short-patch-repair endonuclease
MYFKHPVPPERPVITAYLAGASVLGLATKFGTSRQIINTILDRAGIIRRTAGEQERIKWRKMSARQRQHQTAAAHETRRGQKDPRKRRKARAQTRHERGLHIGPFERIFAQMLDAVGIKYRQQTPCETYNIDFTLTEHPVAVEIVRGSSRHSRSYKSRRLSYVLNHWHLFEIRTTSAYRTALNPKIVEKLIAFANLTCLAPPPPGQHRVIRADGKEPGTCPKVYGRTSKLGTYHLVHRTVGSDGRPL